MLAITFAPAAFAVAAHFTTSRRVLVLVNMAIAASISWSIVVVLFKRRLNERKTKELVRDSSVDFKLLLVTTEHGLYT